LKNIIFCNRRKNKKYKREKEKKEQKNNDYKRIY